MSERVLHTETPKAFIYKDVDEHGVEVPDSRAVVWKKDHAPPEAATAVAGLARLIREARRHAPTAAVAAATYVVLEVLSRTLLT